MDAASNAAFFPFFPQIFTFFLPYVMIMAYGGLDNLGLASVASLLLLSLGLVRLVIMGIELFKPFFFPFAFFLTFTFPFLFLLLVSFRSFRLGNLELGYLALDREQLLLDLE
jgi:hypothetical protein